MKLQKFCLRCGAHSGRGNYYGKNNDDDDTDNETTLFEDLITIVNTVNSLLTLYSIVTMTPLGRKRKRRRAHSISLLKEQDIIHREMEGFWRGNVKNFMRLLLLILIHYCFITF